MTLLGIPGGVRRPVWSRTGEIRGKHFRLRPREQHRASSLRSQRREGDTTRRGTREWLLRMGLESLVDTAWWGDCISTFHRGSSEEEMMLTVKRNGKLVRWAYLFEEWVPPQTTLCALFWRTVLLTPVVKLAFPGVILTGVLALIWTYPWETLKGAGTVLVVLLGIGLVAGVWDWSHDTRRTVGEWVATGYEGIKKRYCPIILLKEEGA